MEIHAEPVKSKDLKPGDLFSSYGPSYWDAGVWRKTFSLGEGVYIRTETPTPQDQADELVYRITIIGD